MKTKKKRHVTVLRSENRIVFDPTTPRLRRLLEPQIQYDEKVFYHGKELFDRKRLGLSAMETVTWQCYGDDHKGRLATSWGFYERLAAFLRENGYTVELVWATLEEAEAQEKREAKIFTPDWSRIDQFIANGFKYRHRQDVALKLFSMFENGRIDCPPAWGKGTLITLGCKLFPKARVGVVSKNVAVLQQRLLPELQMNLPSVGMVGGGMKKKGRRVMCYTADSLHHAPDDLDILFVDEGHQACADKFAASLARFTKAHIWMLSASWDMRLDNKDMRAEAIAGPIRLSVPYQEAVDHNMVVPIEVVWGDVVMDVNPASDLADVDKKRAAYWSNTYRNKKIARAAKLYDESVQTLITVETLEHALYLKKLLPDFEVVYSDRQIKPKDMRWYRELGLIPEGWRPMTPERKQRLTRRFTRGKLKKVIVTTVWNVGVSFNHLQVLIRGDGGGSPVNDTQIPGRTSRLQAKDGAAKICGILHDFRDQFDFGCRQRAARRETNYRGHGWAQHFPAKEMRSLVHQLMGWSN